MTAHLEPEINVAANLWTKGLRFVGCVEDHNRRGRLLFEFADADGQAGLA